MDPFSLYVHIPFCGQRCPYCDFNTYVEAQIPEAEYTEALIRELEQRAKRNSWKGRELQTIFFGGGTPSLFTAESLGALVSRARELFPNNGALETSIEVNPGAVSEAYFNDLLRSGFNRVSIGAQSFKKSALHELGRAHSVEETLEAYASARRAGFENINLDLIYALPNQSIEDFRADLSELIKLDPEHISAYQLTIEKGTPFSFRFHQGDLVLPPEDDVVEMMTLLTQELRAASFAQYEISNFARAGHTCRHNQAYWNGEDYLGLGAGAHSFNGQEGEGFGRRWSNFALPKEYMENIARRGESESWRDSLTKQARKFEFFFLGLRRSSGVSCTAFATAFEADLRSEYQETLDALSEQGLLCIEDDLIFLSERGRLLADSVFQEFVRDE